MTLRFQRLLLILFSLILLITAVSLILYNSRKNLIYFYTPSELLENDLELNQLVRVGAFVAKNSYIKIDADTYEFEVTDNIKSIKVSFTGLLPSLFREGQGAVIEGILLEKNYIKATSVYAKHDENYMPASIKKELEKNKVWKKDYK